jgi:hypothetical protein
MTPLQQDILCALAWMNLSHGQPRQALRLLGIVRAAAPDNVQALRLLACAYTQCQRGPEALQTLDALMALDEAASRAAPVLLMRSRALKSSRREAEARATFQHYLAARRDSLATP